MSFKEGPFMMFFHAVVIYFALFLFMKFILKQPNMVAVNRSMILSAVALIYMILWGHNLPGKLNPGLFY